MKIMSNKKKSVGYTEPTNNGRGMITKYKFRIVRFEVPEPAPRTEKENQLRRHLRFYYCTLISLIVNVFGVAIAIWSPRTMLMTLFSGIWLFATAWVSIIVTINLMSCPSTIMKLRDEVEAEKSTIDISEVSNNEEETSSNEATGTTDSKSSIIDLCTIPEFRNKR
jgi:hypothetical protein